MSDAADAKQPASGANIMPSFTVQSTISMLPVYKMTARVLLTFMQSQKHLTLAQVQHRSLLLQKRKIVGLNMRESAELQWLLKRSVHKCKRRLSTRDIATAKLVTRVVYDSADG